MARNHERLMDFAASLDGSLAIQCDVCDPNSLRTAFSQVSSSIGVIDTLVYNAGSGVWGDALSIKTEDFEAAWRVNALGAFMAAREVLPQMIEAGFGNIIFVGATTSRRGGAMTAAFAPAKAAAEVAGRVTGTILRSTRYPCGAGGDRRGRRPAHHACTPAAKGGRFLLQAQRHR
jgi:NAD(P)-dependent dehydrogenase (short-subunit alcohol dehydrogenase family)